MIFRTIGNFYACFYPWQGVVNHFHTGNGASNKSVENGQLCVSLAKMNLWQRNWQVVLYKGEIGFIASKFLVKVT